MDLCSSSSCWSRVNCSFTVLKITVFYLFILPSLSPPEPLAITDPFTVSIVLPFQNVMELESYILYSLQIGFFHLAICIAGSYMS